MNIENRVKAIVNTTIADVMSGKYTPIEIGEYTSKLKKGSNILEVWIANGVYGCKLENYKGISFPPLDDDQKNILFKIATTRNKMMIYHELVEINKKKKDLYLQYKKAIVQSKNLSAELKIIGK